MRKVCVCVFVQSIRDPDCTQRKPSSAAACTQGSKHEIKKQFKNVKCKRNMVSIDVAAIIRFSHFLLRFPCMRCTVYSLQSTQYARYEFCPELNWTKRATMELTSLGSVSEWDGWRERKREREREQTRIPTICFNLNLKILFKSIVFLSRDLLMCAYFWK